MKFLPMHDSVMDSRFKMREPLFEALQQLGALFGHTWPPNVLTAPMVRVPPAGCKEVLRNSDEKGAPLQRHGSCYDPEKLEGAGNGNQAHD
jgi:hypothetical protein